MTTCVGTRGMAKDKEYRDELLHKNTASHVREARRIVARAVKMVERGLLSGGEFEVVVRFSMEDVGDGKCIYSAFIEAEH